MFPEVFTTCLLLVNLLWAPPFSYSFASKTFYTGNNTMGYRHLISIRCWFSIIKNFYARTYFDSISPSLDILFILYEFFLSRHYFSIAWVKSTSFTSKKLLGICRPPQVCLDKFLPWFLLKIPCTTSNFCIVFSGCMFVHYCIMGGSLYISTL